MRSILQLTFLMSSFALGLPAQTRQSELETFLRQQLGATTNELNVLDMGGIIVKLPKTPETREVVAFAAMRLDVPPDFLIDRVRDIATFKKGDNVLQIGKFSNPPRLEDVASLTLEPADIDAIRLCKVNTCDVKIPARFIERFHSEVNWSAPNYRDRVTELARELLLEYAQAYLHGGNAALGEYNDRSHLVRHADEFRTLLEPAPYMYGYVPEFQKYLDDFPGSRPTDVEDFLYWSKEKFGLQPVVSLTHMTIYKRPMPNGTNVLIASKGIYATRYFEASLGLTAFVHSQSAQASRSYLIYINRSRADTLQGLFGGLKRALISSSLRDGAKKNMELMKRRLESGLRGGNQS